MSVVGCIGCGNMGGGVLKGLVPHTAWTLLGHDHTPAKVEALDPEQHRVEFVSSPLELARRADVIILAVKPHQMEDMLEEIRPALNGSKIVVSLAAAFSLSRLKHGVQNVCPVVRCMPNLPVIVGKGVFALCMEDAALTPEKAQEIFDMFCLMGMAVVLPEAQFPAFSSLVGCGPAFALLFMEGLLNAGITMGLKAPVARELIAAMIEGTARLALESGESFAGLRIRVCSPGGTTIRGVNHMERCAVPGHVADAVLESLRRDLEMASGK